MVAIRGASGDGEVGDGLTGHFVLTEMSIEQRFERRLELAVPARAIRSIAQLHQMVAHIIAKLILFADAREILPQPRLGKILHRARRVAAGARASLNRAWESATPLPASPTSYSTRPNSSASRRTPSAGRSLPCFIPTPRFSSSLSRAAWSGKPYRKTSGP